MNSIPPRQPQLNPHTPEGNSPRTKQTTPQENQPKDQVEIQPSTPPIDHSDDIKKIKLTILHTNDMHGRLTPFYNKLDQEVPFPIIPDPNNPDDIEAETARGGLAHIASIVKQERNLNPNGTLLLDAGDISTGSFVSDFYKGEPMVAAMNTMKYDAVAVGNHEFDKRIEPLRQLIEKAEFPFLSANLVDKEGGADPLPVQKYITKDINGIKIGILGLLTPTTLQQLSKEDRQEIDILGAANTAWDLVPQMKKEGAQLIIVLSHLGIDGDRRLARQVPGIDVIVGGHTHTELSTHEKIDNTHIVQAGSLGTNLGKLELDITRQNNGIIIENAQSKLIPINTDIHPDEQVKAVITKYTSQLSSFLGRVVGTADIDLKSQNYQTSWQESNLADFVTDTLRTHGQADLCLVPPSTFRGNIPAGEVKVSDIYTVFPWDDGLSRIEVSGKTIKNILESGVTGKSLNVTPSGLSFTCDLTRPRGDRITQITMNDNTPLNPDKTYTMVARNYTLDSQAFPEYQDYQNRTHLKESPQEILISRFQSTPSVNQETDGRINIIGLEHLQNKK